MLKSTSHFSDDEKVLIRELFGSKMGGSPTGGYNEQMNELREDNDKLYFEVRQEYGENVEALKKQKEFLKQLQDFS